MSQESTFSSVPAEASWVKPKKEQFSITSQHQNSAWTAPWGTSRGVPRGSSAITGLNRHFRRNFQDFLVQLGLGRLFAAQLFQRPARLRYTFLNYELSLAQI